MATSSSTHNIGIDSLPEALRNKVFTCGDLIVKASPYAHVISLKYNGDYCDWCAMPSKKDTNLLRCSVCKHEHYCNKQCQKKAWTYHKFECPLLKARFPKIPADSVRLLTKILWNLWHGITKPVDDPGWREWNDLCDHSKHILAESDKMVTYMKIALTVFEFVGDEIMRKNGILNTQCLKSVFGRLLCNGYTLTHRGTEVGAAMYIGPSVFNHSCAPNAAHVCDGTTISIRALRDIDTSKEPILVNYIDPMLPLDMRRAELLENYYFFCKCDKCVNVDQEALLETTICPSCGGDVIRQLDDRYLCTSCDKIIDSATYIDSCKRAVSEAGRLCEQALKSPTSDTRLLVNFMAGNRLLSKTNVSLAGVKCTLYADLSQNGDDSEAYALGEELTNLFKLYYPKVFPAHGVHQFKQARLAWTLDRYDLALNHYRQALKDLVLTHGSDHSLTKELISDIPDCERDKFIFEHLFR